MTTQVLHVFVHYAEAHPDKMDLPAAAVAFNAMADAFPCTAIDDAQSREGARSR